MKIDTQGDVAPGFEKVKDIFKANWNGYEVGASYSVVYKGKTVVDIWGGYKDIKGSDPETNVGIGYAMTQMQINLDDESRAGLLVKATCDCL